MPGKKTAIVLLSLFLLTLFLPPLVSAHESYVLTREQFQQGLGIDTPQPFSLLFTLQFFNSTIKYILVLVVVYALVLLWSATKKEFELDRKIRRFGYVGPLVLRFALAASFFFSAQGNKIFGPELPLDALPQGQLIRFALYATSLMFLFGVLTEATAAAGLIMFGYLTVVFGQYMFTYWNYLGELIVLLLFGSRVFSVDKFFFGEKAWFHAFDRLGYLETPIIRWTYGIALIYAGYSIKFAHQHITLAVISQYGIGDFTLEGASYFASAIGLGEIAVGLLIFIGFGQRFSVIIATGIITATLVFFQEMLWPHIMLYALSLALVIDSDDVFTVDRYILRRLRMRLQQTPLRSIMHK